LACVPSAGDLDLRCRDDAQRLEAVLAAVDVKALESVE
jgi:hypothetical protein